MTSHGDFFLFRRDESDPLQCKKCAEATVRCTSWLGDASHISQPWQTLSRTLAGSGLDTRIVLLRVRTNGLHRKFKTAGTTHISLRRAYLLVQHAFSTRRGSPTAKQSAHAVSFQGLIYTPSPGLSYAGLAVGRDGPLLPCSTSFATV